MTPFRWSWSRHRTLRACPRRYWFVYYGARGGWRGAPTDRSRSLYRMRRLVARGQWIGLRVHEVLAAALTRARDGTIPALDAVRADTIRRARRELADARRGLAELDPRRHTDFVERYYGPEPSAAWWDGLVDELVEQVEAAWVHPVMARLLAVPERIVEVERMRVVRLADRPALVALDVLVRDGDGGLVIVDWKTGAHPDPAASDGQLGLYAAAVRQDHPGRPVAALEVTTRLGGFRRVDTRPDAVEPLLALVRASSDAMRDALPDPSSDHAPEDAFPPLPEGAPACASCVFREACGR